MVKKLMIMIIKHKADFEEETSGED